MNPFLFASMYNTKAFPYVFVRYPLNLEVWVKYKRSATSVLKLIIIVISVLCNLRAKWKASLYLISEFFSFDFHFIGFGLISRSKSSHDILFLKRDSRNLKFKKPVFNYFRKKGFQFVFHIFVLLTCKIQTLPFSNRIFSLNKHKRKRNSNFFRLQSANY